MGGELYDGLVLLKQFASFFWLVPIVWLALIHKKLYCHINNIAYMKNVNFLVTLERWVILSIALLPPYTLFNFVFLYVWHLHHSSLSRRRWTLIYHRMIVRDYERRVLQKEGLIGLILSFAKVVDDAGKLLKTLEPGTIKYGLCANFYVKCQRRLEKMKRGENFGHFPIPK